MKLNTEKIDKIRNLLSTEKGLRTFDETVKDVYSKPECDKTGIGFNYDSRFCVFTTKVTFDCLAGYYGSSSCHTIQNGIDGDTAAHLFIAAINQLRPQIFETMANIAKQQAKESTAEAQKEIEDISKLLESAITPKE
jgi:hypothetical protein